MKSRLLLAALAAAQLSAVSHQPSEKPKSTAQTEEAKEAKTSQPNATAVAIPSAQIPQRHEIMRNRKVIVSTTELEPGKTVPMHRHERDYVTVVLTEGQMRETVAGQGSKTVAHNMSRLGAAMHVPGVSVDKVQPGEISFHHMGFTHADENTGKTVLRAITVDFIQPVGAQEKTERKENKYCNQDVARGKASSPKACVEERYELCTEKFCAEDVTMDPGAVSTKHSHSTDHMLIALTDYELTDVAVGKPKKVRRKKAGEVEYIGSGITHQLTNTGGKPARFVVIAFK